MMNQLKGLNLFFKNYYYYSSLRTDTTVIYKLFFRTLPKNDVLISTIKIDTMYRGYPAFDNYLSTLKHFLT